jgi:hypothetical protein
VNVVKTRLATLATMAELHAEASRYDLVALTRLVGEVMPDLLCVEVTRAAWEAGVMDEASLPIRAALNPLAQRSDIVIVPIAADPREHAALAPSAGRGTGWVTALERLHRWVQRRTPARAFNGATYGMFCHTICTLQEAAWTPDARAAWEAENEAMLANLLAAIRRDPARRVLAAMQCQRKHWLDARLRRELAVELVAYWEL